MLPETNAHLRGASVTVEEGHLVATTGVISRVWRLTEAGLATCSVTNLISKQSYRNESPECDWELPGAEAPGRGVLSDLSAKIQDDEGFTSEHIAVAALLDYPAEGITLLWSAWVYPGAPGIRTQLAVKSKVDQPQKQARLQGGYADYRSERLPPAPPAYRRRFFGYYNDTQNRNDTHLDILKEDINEEPLIGREWCSWASAACLENERGGIALIKESHKCVNQAGHATGGFICDEKDGLSSIGWGLKPSEIPQDGFAPCWANWCVTWSGGDLARETALKTFDKTRYPIDPVRDIYIQANTWGSTECGEDARMAATEARVLEELDACAGLGIDFLQIDDGWQVPPGHTTWNPQENGWHPHPLSYPNGWKKIRAKASALGVRLGLWAAAVPITLEELKSNFNDGGFLQYKLDFAVLKSNSEIHSLMSKVREFIKWTDHKVRVNWDVTEVSPRYGYFFAREYGSIYLENRKPVRPHGVVYRPHTVLRDVWQIAKYLNLHRFQCSIQNVDRVDKTRSDAFLHPHSYCTAIALMGIPLFFQETKYYSGEARSEIRSLLQAYKKERESIYKGIVHPIGSKPNNASWTGFQCHLQGENRGYLTIFRERCNSEDKQTIQLGWLKPGQIQLTDLQSGETTTQDVTANGSAAFTIKNAPGFLFLKYSC